MLIKRFALLGVGDEHVRWDGLEGEYLEDGSSVIVVRVEHGSELGFVHGSNVKLSPAVK